MNEASIIGTGRCLPSNVVTNDDLSCIVDTNDEWIRTRTGITKRHVSKEESTVDLGTGAALRALENSNINAEDIDMIITATITPDTFTPSTACLIQDRINAKNAFCFDINAACSGFIYALNTAYQFIRSGECKNALVIGTEVLSKIVNWKMRDTCVLFGDGAGAAVLARTNRTGIKKIILGSDGSKGGYLTCGAVPVKNAFTDMKKHYEDYVCMNGREIFKFAVTIIPKEINRILNETNITIDDIKYIVPHQANYRIIKDSAKRLKVSTDKFYTDLEDYGNTSSASIPIALDDMNSKGLLKDGDKIILVGFGGGLTYGTALIEWNKNV